MCVCVLVAQPCQAPCNPIDCSPPGPSIHRTLQARTLEGVAIFFSKRNYGKKVIDYTIKYLHMYLPIIYLGKIVLGENGGREKEGRRVGGRKGGAERQREGGKGKKAVKEEKLSKPPESFLYASTGTSY